MFLAGAIKGVEQKTELEAIMLMLHTIEEEEESIFLFLLAQLKFGLQVDKVINFIAFVLVYLRYFKIFYWHLSFSKGHFCLFH